MSKKIETVIELAAALKNLQGPIAVFAHRRPDGDALGSTAGMVGLLQSMGKDAFALILEKMPARLAFMMDGLPQKEVAPEILKSSTLLALDSAARDMILIPEGHQIALSIDHHLSHKPYAQGYFVSLGPSSTCEIVVSLARELKATLPAYALQGLYGGIMTDTNRFAWGNAGEDFAKTLEAAAWLVRQGIPARELSDKLTRTVTLPYLKLQAFIVSQRTEFLENGRVAVIHAQADELVQMGCDPADKDILISVFQSIEGVDMVFMVLKDAEGYRLSTRARSDKGRMDLFCARFGGGGHAAAAGANVKSNEPLEVFLPRLRDEIVKHWKAYGPAS